MDYVKLQKIWKDRGCCKFNFWQTQNQ